MTLPVTALTAAICAIMLLATAIATVRARFRTRAAFGDAGDPGLVAVSRSHGNLAEHAPLFVILIGLLEMANASHWPLTALAVLFLGARAAHIIGLNQPHQPGKPPLLRSVGVIGTWAAYAGAIGWTLLLVVTVNG
ncbi:MAPEG family protein [Blastomonas sp.]|uniref:MAPEG family protein n=1 Tax=Blastomonas sp. TaxID=1909299 RepID=UPI0035938B0F